MTAASRGARCAVRAPHSALRTAPFSENPFFFFVIPAPTCLVAGIS